MQTRSRASTLAGYTLVLAVGVATVLLVRRAGHGLAPGGGPPPDPAVAAGGHHGELGAVLLALAFITVAARVGGALFERLFRQPPVMGEIAAGILLGPSALGAALPGARETLVAPAALPHLAVIAQIGVVLFMFLVGLELDPRTLRRSSHATLAIAHVGMIVPFVLGTGLALFLYPLYGHDGTGFAVFALFTGTATSVTAFPVLARILEARNLSTTRFGTLALGAAALGDATAWLVLAFVSGVARAELRGAWTMLALAGAHAVFVLAVVGPIVRRLAKRDEARGEGGSRTALAVIFAALLLSAWVTSRIGIHALFGAFLFGLVMPHEGKLADHVRLRVQDLCVVLLLPIFFAFTGMRTSIGLLGSGFEWAVCGAIVAVATVGKFGGTYVAARFVGMRHRESTALGYVMNARGLMELIVLNVGLDLGILSPRLFAMFVVMALVTTFATSPLLDRVLRGGGLAEGPEMGPDGARTDT